MVPAELTSLGGIGPGDRGRALAKARTDLQRAQEWATKRQGLEEERARLTERIAAAEQDLLKAEWGIDSTAELSEEHRRQLVETAVQELAEAKGAVQTAEAEARHARAELERCQEADRKRTALLGEAETARKAAEQHRLVATALGPDGVQSLLLEASAPAIADAANDLLDKAYGSRWRLRIDLQRASSDGKRQIEDVRLLVRDTTSTASFSDDLEPGEQPIETLSGGESVWIRAALAAAIGQIRAERTGVEWRTVLMDEADAGLDEGAAESYWRLVEAAHAAAGRHHTVAITHSGAQHGLTQRIEMGGLG